MTDQLAPVWHWISAQRWKESTWEHAQLVRSFLTSFFLFLLLNILFGLLCLTLWHKGQQYRKEKASQVVWIGINFWFSVGFGTCCQRITTECGSTIGGNCTYIQNKGFPDRSKEAMPACVFTIERMDEDICFIRLDLLKSEIALPDVKTPTNGLSGDCTTDTVSFT